MKKKPVDAERESKMSAAIDATSDAKILIGKDYFRSPEVNAGFYSRKRQGVADVDPKVSIFTFILTAVNFFV